MPVTTKSFELVDHFGDKLYIIGGPVMNKVTFDSEVDGQETTLVFDLDGARKVAESILEATGQKYVPLSEIIPLASDVSFNEAMLRLACIHKRTVRFNYAKDEGKYIESRRLNPTGFAGEGDTLSVKGHDPDRENEWRAFRLDRIKGEVSFA